MSLRAVVRRLTRTATPHRLEEAGLVVVQFDEQDTRHAADVMRTIGASIRQELAAHGFQGAFVALPPGFDVRTASESQLRYLHTLLGQHLTAIDRMRAESPCRKTPKLSAETCRALHDCQPEPEPPFAAEVPEGAVQTQVAWLLQVPASHRKVRTGVLGEPYGCPVCRQRCPVSERLPGPRVAGQTTARWHACCPEHGEYANLVRVPQAEA